MLHKIEVRMLLRCLVLFFFGAFFSVFLFSMEAEKLEQYELWIRKDGPIVIHSDQGTISKIQSFCNRVKSWQSNAHLLVCEDAPGTVRTCDNQNPRKLLYWHGFLNNINATDIFKLQGGYVVFFSFKSYLFNKYSKPIGVFIVGLSDKQDLELPGLKKTIEQVVLMHEYCLCNIL